MLRRLSFFFSISLLFNITGSLLAQERWSNDPRMTGLKAQDRAVLQPSQPPTPYVHPVQDPRVYHTPIGVMVVNPNVRVHPSSNTQSEVIITRHPSNQNIMFGSSNSVNSGVTFISEGVYMTTNGGTSWFGSDTLSGAPIGSHGGDPGPTIDKNGTLIESHLGSGGMYANYSTDNGATWSATYTITSSSSDKNLSGTDDAPSSAFYGRSYTVWSDFSASSPPMVISYTTNGGVSWSAKATINTPPASHYSQGCDIRVGPNGEVYVVWTAPISASPYTGDFLGFAKSTNGGVTWTVTENAYDMNGIRGTLPAKASIRVNDFPRIDVDRSGGSRNGWIYVVTGEKSLSPAGSDPDIVLHRSTDGGTSWSAGIRVNQDALNNGKTQYMPAIRVDEAGGVNVIYYDDRNTSADSAEVYVSRSLDGGTTWTDILVSDHRFKPKPISGLATGYQGDYIGITSGSGRLWPFWMDDASGLYQAWTTYVLLTPPNAGFVKGTVTSGGGLSGVLVDFTNPVTQIPSTTDATGYYKASASVEPGTTALLTIRGQKFGYVTKTDTVTVVRGDTVTRNLSMTLAPSGTLQVHAYKNDLSGIRAAVVVKLGSTTVFSDSTNATTGLISTALPTGTYDVTVDPPSPYGTRTFAGVVITASTTTPLEALVRYVIEPSPAAMRDTLAVGQTHGKTMVLTNTTSSPVAYQISDDNALLKISNVSKPRPTSVRVYESYTLPKGVEDTHPGYTSPDGQGGPDTFGHEWIDSDAPGGPTFGWVDISSIGTQITTWNGTADDGRRNVGLPFTFNYYGSTYDSLKICTNGWVSFDKNSTSVEYSNSAIPSSGEPNNAIYPFWDDLDLRTSGTVHYYNDGANNRFIVQYTNAPHYSGTTGTYTFQVILNSDGTIICQYLTMLNTVTSATIGIENSGGTDGLMVVNSLAYMHDNLAIKFFVPNAAWVSESPTSGTIPGNSTQNITVTFDATGLTTGNTYNGVISIDPDHADVTGTIDVPASLKVQLAGSAVLILNKSTITFPATQLFTTRKDTISAKNGGSTTLNITSITRLNTDYSVTPASGTLAPGDSMPVVVSYTPTAAGSDTGRVIFLSNSSGTPQLDVILNGTGVAYPLISVRPDSVVKVLAPNTTSTDTVVIKNTGLGTLNWAIAESSPASPGVRPTAYFTPGPPLAKGMDDGRSSPMGSGGPDVFGYRWKDSDDPNGPTFAWVDISGTGTALDSASAWTLTGTFEGGDEGYYPVALPFSFSYYGVLRDSVFIGSNGQVMFQRPTGNTFTNAQFPTAGGVIDNQLGPFWDDLEVHGVARVYFGLSGSDFVIQFDQVSLYNVALPDFTFEVILKPTGEWLYQYLNMSINGGTLTSASIGMENPGGTDGLSVVNNAAYIHNNLAILFRKGVSWIDENPQSGSINPGDSTKVVLTFDSNGLADGDYNEVLQITSNDATNNPVNIPVHLTVGSSSVNVSVIDGWNLISNPVTTTDDSVRQLYPSSAFDYAFEYTPGSGYSQKYIMQNGKGYWEKFSAGGSSNIAGTFITEDSIDVVDGWNILGSISTSVDTSTISTVPGGLRVSPYYGFGSGYVPATSITPGQGYWMKANGSGKVILSSTLKPSGATRPASQASAFEDYSALTIKDNRGASQTLYMGRSTSEAYEMPPAGPAGTFDARFASQRMIEAVSGDQHQQVDYPITIQSAAYPLTVSWNVRGDHRLSLRDGITGSLMSARSVSGTGQVSITSPSITRLIVSAQPTSIPISFELSQNFPNPFNPTTQIRYALPEAATVSLKVFDLLGQEVFSVATGMQNAGYYSTEWNGRNNSGAQLASGVYFYKLEAVTASGHAFRSTRKMTLMK